MLTAKIFQQNITQSSIESDKVLGFNNCIVEISKDRLKIWSKNDKILETELTCLRRIFQLYHI